MQLVRLQVSDLATIQRVDVDLSEGFHVFTGETGAGKTIIIDAVRLLAGGRADTTLIRKGADRLVVEGIFVTRDPRVLKVLSEAGLDVADNQIIVRREVMRSQSSRIYLNQSPVTLQFLSDLLAERFRVHGQSDQLKLMKGSFRTRTLDLFGGHGDLLEKAAGVVKELRQEERKYREMQEAVLKARQERDLLILQKNEIESAGIKDGEEAELRRQKDFVKNREALAVALGNSRHLLTEGENNLLSEATALKSHLSLLAETFSEIRPYLLELDPLCDMISDLSVTVEKCAGDMEAPTISLNDLEERLVVIESLKKRYGPTEKEILAHLGALQTKLETADRGDSELLALKKNVDSLSDQYRGLSRELSEKRRFASRKMSREVEKHLHSLQMDRASFRIVVESEDGPPTPEGNDRVLFQVAPNPGEGIMPIEKIASGGELSRIQLAIVACLRDPMDEIMVFDEIDQGVGGSTALEIGSLLKKLSGLNQVLVVTHLPQVAATADHHFHLTKESDGTRTKTLLKKLEQGERLEILAAMLSGNKITKAARTHADELFRKCQNS